MPIDLKNLKAPTNEKTEVSNSIQLTKFTADNGTLMTKKIELEEGALQKISAPQLTSGSAEKLEIKHLSDIETIVNNLDSNQCISTGIFDLAECDITTTAKLTEKAVASGFRSRTKSHMEQPQNGLLLLDYDPSPYMPQNLQCSTPEEVMQKIAKAVPELEGVCWSATGSCSNGVYSQDGSIPPTQSGGMHIYIETQGIDHKQFQQFIEAKLWAADYGYIALAKNGVMLQRSLIDLSVLSPERLIFEARPVLGEGLEQHPRTWTHVEGKALTYIPEITEEELATMKQKIVEAKQSPELQAKQIEINNEYCDNLVPTLVERLAITEGEATKRAQRYKGQLTNITDLVPNNQVPELIDVNGEWLKPLEICARWEELDGVSIPDPIEGREYGESTAIIYGNGGSPAIHSFAHGISRLYSMVQFEVLEHETIVIRQEPNTLPVPSKKEAPALPAIPDSLTRPPLVPLESFPDLKNTNNGSSPKGTLPNFQVLLDHYSITARYNLIKKTEEIVIPGLRTSLDNTEKVGYAIIKSLCVYNGFPVSNIDDYITAVADVNQYNPADTWVRSNPWDGKDRIQAVSDTFHERSGYPKPFKQLLLRKFSISAVAAAIHPGFHSRGVLTIQGPQGCGKTTAVRNFTKGSGLTSELIATGVLLDPANKDSIIQCKSHWIVELGELDSTFKRDIGRIKGFLTNVIDSVREPYGRKASKHQRRTVFCATVNEDQFLVDTTGNSRFWVIPVDRIDYEHNIDMQQYWAQVLTLYEVGEQWWLTPDEEQQLEKLNRNHRVVGAIEELILDALNLDRQQDPTYPHRKRLGASQLLKDIGITRPTNVQSKDCARVLREQLGEPVAKSGGVLKWDVPLKQENR